LQPDWRAGLLLLIAGAVLLRGGSVPLVIAACGACGLVHALITG